MHIFDLKRNDVAGAVAYYGERRAELAGAAPDQRQAIVAPLFKLHDDPTALGRALRDAYPADFPRPA